MAAGRIAVLGVALAIVAGPASHSAEAFDAQAYVGRAIALLRAQHMNAGRADWPKLEAEARAAVANATRPEETYPAIRDVIAALDERHTLLIPAQVAGAQRQGQDARSGLSIVTPTPTGVMLEGRVALLTIPGFSGSVAAAEGYTVAGRSVLAGLDARGACGWIVDLRANSGGNMWPMLGAVAPLLGKPPFGAFLDREGRRTGVWTLVGTRVALQTAVAATGSPSPPALDARLGAAPVAVLVGARTGSSGEFTAMGFAGRPNAALFGPGTAGYVTVNNSAPLSDGARLAISTGWAEDRSGQAYKIRIDPGAASDQAALDQAIAWLRTRGCPAS